MYTKELCKTIEFGTVLKQSASIALPLEQLRLLANGSQEWRLACSDQAPMADIFVGNRHKWAGFDIALGVYVERQSSCPRALILYAIFIVRELAYDDRFTAPELENAFVEGDLCGFIQDPLRPRVRATRYIFCEKTNRTANGDHLVDELIGSELRGIGRGVCGNEAIDSMSFTEVVKGTKGGLVSARLATLVSVVGKSIDTHEQDNVSTPGNETGNLGCYERAIGNKEE